METYKKYNIDSVVHFAAESHVDNSIKNPFVFTHTNVIGTHTLLEAAKQYWREGSENKFVHVSTDEVFGTLGETGYFTETSPIQPNSPYSASKASSDLIAFAYAETYKMLGEPSLVNMIGQLEIFNNMFVINMIDIEAV